MSEILIDRIAKDLKELGKQILFVENTDDFLIRKDVKKALAESDVLITEGPQIRQRLFYELRNFRYHGKVLVFLTEENFDYLEDMWKAGMQTEFRLDRYLYGFHQGSVINLKLSILDKLFGQKRVKQLSKEETLREIQLVSKNEKPRYEPDLQKIGAEVQNKIGGKAKDWHAVIKIVSHHLRSSIGTGFEEEIFAWINKVNSQFQKELELNYKSLVSSSPVKKPAIVSKILDHLVQKPRHEKVALLVIDGMSYWQYQLIKEHFPESFKLQEELTYSWVPSVTELSRQAIFKGSAPDYDYVQNPRNEEKLWRSYWKKQGFGDHEIEYQHSETKLGDNNILRLAVVLKELDDKMHSSDDYEDLKVLTQLWVKRSKLLKIIAELLERRYTLYITTDHGNIEATGWRNLKGVEKLGTHNSRSQRHLYYSEDWIADDFLNKNPELTTYIARDESTIYFKNDYSFSNKDSLITHGGSHILEVLIPFVKITY